VRIKERWSGNVTGDEMTIRQPGGRTETLVTRAGPSPEFEPNQTWILCLTKPPAGSWTVLGIKQGAFRVDGGIGRRDFTGFHFIRQPPESVQNQQELIGLTDLRDRLSTPQSRNRPAATTTLEMIHEQQVVKVPSSPSATVWTPSPVPHAADVATLKGLEQPPGEVANPLRNPLDQPMRINEPKAHPRASWKLILIAVACITVLLAGATVFISRKSHLDSIDLR